MMVTVVMIKRNKGNFRGRGRVRDRVSKWDIRHKAGVDRIKDRFLLSMKS